MINLLADVRKNEIKAARANVILARYAVIALLALAFLAGALYVSHSVLKVTMKNAEDIIAANDVKADVYSGTKERVDALSAKLSEAKTVLDQESRYSTVLVKLGQAMPKGAVLGEAIFKSENFNGTPAEITAYTRSTGEATLLQSQLQNSGVFSQVSLKGTEATGGIEGYPVVVTMSVTLNRAGV